MKSETYYEWVIEDLSEHGDIENTQAFDKFYEAFKRRGDRFALGLTLNVGNQLEGVTFRDWAYIEKGELPDCFEGGDKIPERFRKEMSVFSKELNQVTDG